MKNHTELISHRNGRKANPPVIFGKVDLKSQKITYEWNLKMNIA